jgi:ParB family chromosome partitioning protein
MKKIQEKKKKQSKKRLGMGLSSLLSKDEGLASVIKAKINTQIKNGGNSSDQKKPTFDLIKTSVDEKISSIKPKSQEGQTRLPKHFDQNELEELAESIRTNGILQPILVRKLSAKGATYEIIAGERRWRAAQIAKIHEVPVIIRDFDDSTALGVAMIENLQRSDLNIIEEAEGYRSLMLKYEYTQEKLSSQLGKSRSHVANVLRMLSLPSYVKRHIVNGDLTFGHARALVSVPEEQSKELTDKIIDEDLSVRKTEKIVNQFKRSSTITNFRHPAADKTVNANVEYLERELTNLLGLKVTFNHKTNNSGNMSIHYNSLDQIQPVIDKLKWRPK